MPSSLLEVSANSSGYLALKFNRKLLKNNTNLKFAQIVNSIDNIKIGDKYSTLKGSSDADDVIAPEDDFTHRAANQAAVQEIMVRHASGDNTMSIQAKSSPRVGGLIKLPTTTGGSLTTTNQVQYPNRYWIVGYDDNKTCVFISQHPCRDPVDQYFELLSTDGKFSMGWDNTHCYYDGYVALYNYEPATGNNSPDLGAYKSSQKTTKGSTYATGIADDGNLWYIALCTKDYTNNKDNILRILGVVESLQLYDVKYDNTTNGAVTTQNEKSYTCIVSNNDSSPQTCIAAQTFTLTQTYTWSVDIGAKVGVKVSLTTGIPFIQEGSVEVNIESSFNWSTQTTNTKTQTVSLTQNVLVQPNSQNTVTFDPEIGEVSQLRYTAMVRVYCRGNQQFESTDRNISGEYSGSVSNRIKVDIGPSTKINLAPFKTMSDEDSLAAPSHGSDVKSLVHVVADEDTAMGSSGTKQSATFVGDADTIYWYYVDENDVVHPISGGI